MRNQDLKPSVSVLKPSTLLCYFSLLSRCRCWLSLFFRSHPNKSLEMTSKEAYAISVLKDCLRSAVWNSLIFSHGIDVAFKMCQAIANDFIDVNSSNIHHSEAVWCCYYYFQWGKRGTFWHHRANKVQSQLLTQAVLLLSLCFWLYRLHPLALYSHVTCPRIWQWRSGVDSHSDFLTPNRNDQNTYYWPE